MSESVNFTAKYEAALKMFWNNNANVNNDGDSKGVIDKTEATQNVTSLFFVEEGMNESQFIEKNLDVAATEMLAIPTGYNGTKTQYAVSKIVNEMLDEIEEGKVPFEAKRDILIGKMKFLDEETKDRVNKFMLEECSPINKTPDKEKEKSFTIKPGEYGFSKGGIVTFYSDGTIRNHTTGETRLSDGTFLDNKGQVIQDK